MAGRWKTLFICIVIAAAGLIYLASFKLPVVAAMEQAVDVVADHLPSLVNETVGTLIGTEQEDAPADTEQDITDSSQTASPQEEALVTDEAVTDASSSNSETTLSTGTEPTSTDPISTYPTELADSTNPDPSVSDPADEDKLAIFMSTRKGLVTSGTTNFPAHDVNTTGEFVFQTPSIYGSHFSAIKHRPIPESAEVPTYYSALTSYNNGNMNGFELYKNMNHDPSYGDCYIAMSAGGQVSFTNLSMEVTELYGQQLIGVRTFLIPELWTTNPGEDLPLGAGEVPPAPNDPFSGNNFKVTVMKMIADYIEFPNFSLSVAPGRK